MNIYHYWYITFYHIFFRLNPKDRYFYITANGVFGLIIAFMLCGIIAILIGLFSINGKWEAIDNVYIIGPSILINYLYFNRIRRTELYELYSKSNSTKRDLIVIFLSISSIILYVVGARMNM